MWVSIEGNIGSGKSTVIRTLRERFAKSDLQFLKEPEEEWKNALEAFYADPKRYAFVMQSKVARSLRKLHERTKGDKVTERSLFTSKNVFARMLYESGKFDPIEYAFYLEANDDIPVPHYFIYLRSNPATCFQRICRRGDQGITLEYLNDLHEMHEKVFLARTSSPWTLVIDANDVESKVLQNVDDVLVNLIQ